MSTENPDLYRVRQTFERPTIADVGLTVRQEFSKLGLKSRIGDGKRVGITVGSRGIKDILPILLALVDEVKACGGEPFLLAAMGSHGGGTEDGQREVLQSLGITENALGAPVVVCAEGTEIGETEDGLKAFVLKSAFSVDFLLPVNRVKIHTAFHGAVESGIFKMLVVGLGGPKGAAQFHSLGSKELPRLLLDVGDIILRKMPVLGGFAIVENGYEETALIRGMHASKFSSEEPKVLDYARSLMPSLPVRDIDVLIIEEMGKNYSGTGVDTNIIGRLRIDGMPEPEYPSVKKIAVLGLSEESHGNANGLGLMDMTTKKLVESIDRKATYLNCVTTGFLNRGAIPMYCDTEREMMELLFRSLGAKAPRDIRLVQIPNTLHLTECFVSGALLSEIKSSLCAEVVDGPFEMDFDEAGDLTNRLGP